MEGGDLTHDEDTDTPMQLEANGTATDQAPAQQQQQQPQKNEKRGARTKATGEAKTMTLEELDDELARQERAWKRARKESRPAEMRVSYASDKALEHDTAVAVGINANQLTEEEEGLLPPGTDEQLYTKVRNHILAKWRADVTRWLTEEEAGAKIDPRFRYLVAPAYRFLTAYGYINFGVAPQIQQRQLGTPDDREAVIVIGAGLAGLAAARQLRAFGHKVLVVEGRDRPGGRVYTKRMEAEGQVAAADLGGSILTGIDGNPLAVLARQLHIPMHDINTGSQGFAIHLDSGTAPDPVLDDEIYREFNSLLDTLSKHRDEMASASRCISLGCALETMWASLHPAAGPPNTRADPPTNPTNDVSPSSPSPIKGSSAEAPAKPAEAGSPAADAAPPAGETAEAQALQPTADPSPAGTADTPAPAATGTPAAAAADTPAPTSADKPTPAATGTPAAAAADTPAPASADKPTPAAADTPACAKPGSPEPAATAVPAPATADTPAEQAEQPAADAAATDAPTPTTCGPTAESLPAPKPSPPKTDPTEPADAAPEQPPAEQTGPSKHSDDPPQQPPPASPSAASPAAASPSAASPPAADPPSSPAKDPATQPAGTTPSAPCAEPPPSETPIPSSTEPLPHAHPPTSDNPTPDPTSPTAAPEPPPPTPTDPTPMDTDSAPPASPPYPTKPPSSPPSTSPASDAPLHGGPTHRGSTRPTDTTPTHSNHPSVTSADPRLMRRLFDWHVANVEFANAAKAGTLSLKYWDQDDLYELMGPHVFVPGGNLRLVAALTEGLPVLYRSRVDKVQYTQKGVAVVLDDGTVLKADAALVTIPLGVLKAGDVAFEPPLPARKQGAIKRLGFGVLNKVALLFPYVFWDDNLDMFGRVVEDTAHRGDAYLFYSYAHISGGALLAGLVAGTSAETLEEEDPGQAVERVMAWLRRVHEPKGVTVPAPLQAVVTKWGADPFARGSYSSCRVGSLGADDYDILAENVGGRLFFAGEATIKKYPATMHGAFLSGLREAANISAHFAKQRASHKGGAEATGRQDAPGEEDVAGVKVLMQASRALSKVFREVEPDMEFGFLSALWGPAGGVHREEALVRVDLGSMRGASRKELVVYTVLDRGQVLALREVKGGDEARLTLMTEVFGIKVLGRGGLEERTLQLFASVVSARKLEVDLAALGLAGGEAGEDVVKAEGA